MKIRSKAILAMLALIAGCQSTSTPSSGGESSATMPPHAAGILSDYSHLKPDPNREGTWSYVDKTVDIRPYTKLYFDPVKVIATPSPEQSELPPDVVQRMSAKLLASFEKPLSPAYQVVSAPGPDVLRVRTAITGIQAVKPPLHA